MKKTKLEKKISTKAKSLAKIIYKNPTKKTIDIVEHFLLAGALIALEYEAKELNKENIYINKI
jgi:hypothetical protein